MIDEVFSAQQGEAGAGAEATVTGQKKASTKNVHTAEHLCTFNGRFFFFNLLGNLH